MTSIDELLLAVRKGAQLSQCKLAQLAGTSQPTLARYESGDLIPRLETLERIVHAADYELILQVRPATRRGSQTITELGADLKSLSGTESVSPTWRRVLDFVDDFRASSKVGQAWLVANAPPLSEDRRIDALLAGVVEELCAESGVSVPTWVDDEERFVEPWWFISDLPGFEATALRDSPFSFSRHGVFITREALSRV